MLGFSFLGVTSRFHFRGENMDEIRSNFFFGLRRPKSCLVYVENLKWDDGGPLQVPKDQLNSSFSNLASGKSDRPCSSKFQIARPGVWGPFIGPQKPPAPRGTGPEV